MDLGILKNIGCRFGSVKGFFVGKLFGCNQSQLLDTHIFHSPCSRTYISWESGEYAFHNILVAEITKKAGGETLNEETHEKVKIVVQSLVEMMDESTKIVGFFDKWDEVKRVKKDIKRTVIEEFDDLDLVKPVTDRFMELAEVKFK